MKLWGRIWAPGTASAKTGGAKEQGRFRAAGTESRWQLKEPVNKGHVVLCVECGLGSSGSARAEVPHDAVRED